MMTNLWASLRRTLVPIVVGSIMASAAGPYLDERLVTEAVVAVAAVIYYAVFRALELAGVSWASLLLGSRLMPHYDLDTGVVAEVPLSQQVADDPADDDE